jgi:hypothetical protein
VRFFTVVIVQIVVFLVAVVFFFLLTIPIGPERASFPCPQTWV